MSEPESSRNLTNTLQALSRALLALGPDVPHDPRLDDLITTLPRLSEEDVDKDGVCPICLVPFRAHLAEEEMASVVESPAHPVEDLGITCLENTCKHVFCRKDISTWIRQSRNSCPTCRTPLLPPLSEQGQESTGGQTNEDDPQAAVRMVDDVIREVLETLGPATDGRPSEDQLRTMVETLLPNIQLAPHLEPQTAETVERDYPDRSEFGMYS
ncbi:hypothetical protein BU17DRAFT_80361 [Hysterangium stoloniferum]|nr:hypothetical protein BU17DRAFT_80361 [Hysterangium stoloniferum]